MMGLLEQRAGLAGRHALVVGGGDGIGRALTLALAGAGMDVAFCDTNETESQITAAAVAALGQRCLAVKADATVPEELAQFYAEAANFLESADVVINVVGGVLMQPFLQRSAADCAADIQRNFGYVLDSTRHAVPMLRRGRRGGSIINFTTIEAHRGAGGFAVYAGAKAATTAFSKAMAWELGPENIRVNVVAPDTTDSPGNRSALPPGTRDDAAPMEAWAGAFAMYIPLQRPPSPDDLANAVLFLASDLASSITGQVLHVDGGTAASLGMLRWPYDGGQTLPIPVGPTLAKLFPGAG